MSLKSVSTVARSKDIVASLPKPRTALKNTIFFLCLLITEVSLCCSGAPLGLRTELLRKPNSAVMIFVRHPFLTFWIEFNSSDLQQLILQAFYMRVLFATFHSVFCRALTLIWLNLLIVHPQFLNSWTYSFTRSLSGRTIQRSLQL